MTSSANPEDMTCSYGLAPMQVGMLFQSQLTGSERGHGFDIEQLHLTFQEPIDGPTFSAAWTCVVRRHPALASRFVWDRGDSPQQQVVADVTVPVEVEDWSDLTEAECQRRLSAFLLRDRRRGFDLCLAPLVRVSLFLLGGQRAEAVWTFHHILLDGESFATVLTEVMTAYEALRSAKEPSFPSAPPPYRDYLAWLASRGLEPSRRFFHTLLAGVHAPTPLPCAEPSARPLPREGYDDVLRSVAPEVLLRLQALADRTRTSLSTLAHAAWAVVLARYTRESTVLFGATRNCRRDALAGEARNMVGLFINTLPLCVRMDALVRVGDLLASVRQQWVASREHLHIALTEIQGQSDIPRGAPLFESLVLFENQELNSRLRRQRGWETRVCTLFEQPTPPLNIVFQHGDRLTLRLLFERRRFYDAAIARLADALIVVLSAFADAGEHGLLSELPIMAAEELDRIVHGWNHTGRPFADGEQIQHAFEARAREQPEAYALEFQGQTLTYGEVERRANRLAHALRARGADLGAFVSVCLPRGFDLVISLLAIVKSGAAYLPLDPRYPKHRLSLLLADGRVRLAITDQAHSYLLDCEFLLVDKIDLAAQPENRPAALGLATSTCYAIFTSGSTGRPNGVLLSHRAVVNTLEWVNRTFAVGRSDRMLFVTSPCFDLSVYDIFGILGAGGTLVIASEQELSDPQRMYALLIEARITIWDSAPAALQTLVSSFGIQRHRSPLRLVLLSGDWIALSLPPALRSEFPRAQVIGLGGATEAAIWSNWFAIEELDPRWTSVPYGRPIQNARYHVLDEEMRPVPVGVRGDLYIGGVCLAEGYLNQPELTSARFVPDPFRAGPGERLYKTGDLARYFEDGTLEFLGRTDTQIKVRGFRVEMAEVESALLALPGVREVVCAAYRDASAHNALVAYVVPDLATGEPNEGVLRQLLTTRIPEFMVPSQVVFLSELPLSANGKVDRKALPATQERPRSSTFVAARSPKERELSELWGELLNVESVGVTDDFFSLGGHSLLALELVSKAKRKLGLDVAVPDLLRHPTIAGLLEAIDARAIDQTKSGLVCTFNGGGPRTPIVLLGGGPYSLLYREFAKLFGKEQPVHLIQLSAADSQTRSAHLQVPVYERELLALSLTGPCVLGGLASGAAVAFELAQRLQRRGVSVPLLVLIDAPLPPASLTSRVPGEKDGRAPQLHSVPAKASRFARKAGRTLRQIFHRHVPDASAAVSPHLDAAALLLVCEEHAHNVAPADAAQGWRRLISGPVTTLSLPGDHMAFLSEGAHSTVFTAIRERLDDALRGHR